MSVSTFILSLYLLSPLASVYFLIVKSFLNLLLALPCFLLLLATCLYICHVLCLLLTYYNCPVYIFILNQIFLIMYCGILPSCLVLPPVCSSVFLSPHSTTHKYLMFSIHTNPFAVCLTVLLFPPHPAPSFLFLFISSCICHIFYFPPSCHPLPLPPSFSFPHPLSRSRYLFHPLFLVLSSLPGPSSSSFPETPLPLSPSL